MVSPHSRWSLGAAAAFGLAVAAPLCGQEPVTSGAPPTDSIGRCRGAPPDTVPLRGGCAALRIASGQVLDSTVLHRFPVTDPRQLVALLPGVSAGVDGLDLLIRGGTPAIYVDGALIRNGQLGTPVLLLGTNGLADLSVTTGVPRVAVGETQSGVLSYLTRTGGPRLAGSLRYRTDDVGFDPWRNIGFNRVEATFGGPLGRSVTLFTALTIDGRKSLETAKLRDVEAPVYVIGGVDTVVRQPGTVGDPLADTIDLSIPRFVQYSGYCEASHNAGAQCQGLRIPFSARGDFAWQTRLQRGYGRGSLVSLTLLAGGSQARDFPGTELYNPQSYSGSSMQSRIAILDWTHAVSPRLTVEMGVSLQRDQRIAGLLTRTSDLESRDPFGGFLLGGLDYLVGFDTRHDVTIGPTTYQGVGFLDDRQIQCLQAGEGYCQDNVPFFNRNDLLPVQPYRMNPYAVEQSNQFPLYTQGTEGTVDLSREHRTTLRAGAVWRGLANHQFRAGLEHEAFDTRHYQSLLLTSYGMSAYHERPVRASAWIEDSLATGAFLVVGGLRLDRFDSRAAYPVTPGRISSDTLPLDPNAPTANFVRADGHTAVSPRLGVAYRLAPGSELRLSAGREARIPPFDQLFLAMNTDVAYTTGSQVFGRDLDFEKTSLVELGLQQTIGTSVTVDLAAYTQGFPSELFVRLIQLPDPHRGGATSDFRVFQNEDGGRVRGLDLRMDYHPSRIVSSWIAYTYEAVTSIVVKRRQAIAGALAVTVPSDWRPGTLLGSVLADAGAVAVFRSGSGRRFTPAPDLGYGLTGYDLPTFFITSTLYPSVLPWWKTFDVRVTHQAHIGRAAATVFAESQNLFNWTNLTDIFTETGTTTNAFYRQRFLFQQTAVLEQEAAAVNLLTTVGGGETAVDLSAPNVCLSWTGINGGGNYVGGPADCVLLQRAERRFGNGDGVFTQSEFTRAFTAWYDLANAPYRFYGPGRRIRVGVEFRF